MTQGIYKWSLTAGSNATADSSINWAEGQAPSSVNDSARAMMARIAEFRLDISGTITTAGTSTAYTVGSNEVFDALADMAGAMVAFVPHTTNGATVTLNVDGLGAKPLRLGPNLELQSGVLIQGTPYVASYNNTDGAFYLQGGFANPYGIPLGGMMPYIGSSAPNSAFVLPFGQAISRTTYATLFALVNTTFGAGDGSTTFNLPDLRGRAIFGLDNMGGSAASRITAGGGNFDGTVLGNNGGGQNQTLTQAQLPVFSQTPTFTGTADTWAVDTAVPTGTVSVRNDTAQVGVIPNNDEVTAHVTVTPRGSVSAISFGSGSSHPILPPAMTLPYILRVI